MEVAKIYADALDGDKVFSKGSLWVRIPTGESYSHVGVLVWIAGRLFVSEFVEGKGYQMMPFSQWRELRDEETLFYGRAPDIVRGNPKVMDVVVNYRDMDAVKVPWWKRMLGPVGYGYISLIKVWWSQITKKPVGVIQRVCSTFAQEIDRKCGVVYTRTADPGDIAEKCAVSVIE